MSRKPTAKVVPLPPRTRRAKRGHQIARSSTISKLGERVAQLEVIVAAIDHRMARGPFNRRFQLALAGSILLHLVVIALVTFTIPPKHTVAKDQTLEVVLVNAKSKTKPVTAQALAQHNLEGGGNTDADRRAKSPLPVLRSDPRLSDVAVAQKRVEQLEQEVRQLMTQPNSRFAVTSAPTQPTPQVQPQPDAPPSLTQLDVLRTLNIQRLEAEIAKQWDAYQKRPRRHIVGASASEYRFARYVEDWRQKVERIGEANYPQAARDQKIYGSLLLIVSVKSDGSVDNIEMRRSSGSKILDDAAIRIVRMGAPYAAFPPDVAKDTDVIDISRTWRFTSSDRLETE